MHLSKTPCVLRQCLKCKSALLLSKQWACWANSAWHDFFTIRKNFSAQLVTSLPSLIQARGSFSSSRHNANSFWKRKDKFWIIINVWINQNKKRRYRFDRHLWTLCFDVYLFVCLSMCVLWVVVMLTYTAIFQNSLHTKTLHNCWTRSFVSPWIDFYRTDADTITAVVFSAHN